MGCKEGWLMAASLVKHAGYVAFTMYCCLHRCDTCRHFQNTAESARRHKINTSMMQGCRRCCCWPVSLQDEVYCWGEFDAPTAAAPSPSAGVGVSDGGISSEGGGAAEPWRLGRQSSQAGNRYAVFQSMHNHHVAWPVLATTLLLLSQGSFSVADCAVH